MTTIKANARPSFSVMVKRMVAVFHSGLVMIVWRIGSEYARGVNRERLQRPKWRRHLSWAHQR
jgi:hypothetical protein